MGPEIRNEALCCTRLSQFCLFRGDQKNLTGLYNVIWKKMCFGAHINNQCICLKNNTAFKIIFLYHGMQTNLSSLLIPLIFTIFFQYCTRFRPTSCYKTCDYHSQLEIIQWTDCILKNSPNLLNFLQRVNDMESAQWHYMCLVIWQTMKNSNVALDDIIVQIGAAPIHDDVIRYLFCHHR